MTDFLRRPLAIVACALALQASPGSAHENLESAYAELGFDPRASGNAVIVYFSDPHMNLNPKAAPYPDVTTNLYPGLLEEVNRMDPPPAKIIVAGDVTSNMSVIPGHDATGDAITYMWATNEMAFFLKSIEGFTNVARSNIVWIPGNHDQGAREQEADTFRRMFPGMPAYQRLDVAGMPFLLVNSGNYGESTDAQREWLRAQAASIPKTQSVAVVTHQRPFAGVVVHRGIGPMLREFFGDWEERWWVLDGHEHTHGLEVINVGKSNVAQLTVGPAGTNTFVGYTYDAGFMVLCLTNRSLMGYVYHHFRDRSYRVGNRPDWNWPKSFIPAFEGVDGILWRRLKNKEVAPELVSIRADNSVTWWAYPQLLEWEVDLARHGNLATHFMLLVAGLRDNVVFECSIDGTNWTKLTYSEVFNSTYSYPLPPEMTGAPKLRLRFRGTDGNNWIGGWGLRTTNDVPLVTFPQLQAIPEQAVTAGHLLVMQTSTLNPYAPPDRHEFRMVAGPEDAWVNRRTGVFYWQPTIAESPATVSVTLEVRDNGTPPMASVQQFTIDVARPAGPVLETVSHADSLHLTVTAATGTYHVFASANNEDWSLLTSTNVPDTRFEIVEPTLEKSHRFYRVRQEPGTPELELPAPVPGQSPYRFHVQVQPGHFEVEVSDDMLQWATLHTTNLPPVRLEIQDPAGTSQSPRNYEVLGGTKSRAPNVPIISVR